MSTTRDDVWTIPNAICVLRILGTAPLLWSAWSGYRQVVLWIMIALLLSDWLDGKLAILLDQRTRFGARLDSAADALMYAALGVAFWWLEGDAVREHALWVAAVLGTWALSAAVALVRFGGLPGYHTRGAKIAWLLVGVGGSVLLLTGDATAVPWVLGFATLVNLEAVAIGCVLPERRVDVSGLVRALRIRREHASSRLREP